MLQSPLGAIVPENYVWIKFIPRKLVSQSVAAQRGTGMQAPRIEDGEIKLLAPEQIMYTLNHAWGEYESMATRLLSKYGEFAKMANEGSALRNALPDIAKKVGSGAAEALKGNYRQVAQNVKSALDRLQGGLSGAAVSNTKVDLPLVFQGSERRQLTLEFNLIGIRDIKKEVYDIVKQFELYSAAESAGQISIDPPHIFTIVTEPGDIINISRAVLESVQPTWKSPYDGDGYPHACQLTLTFKDMSPLYKRTLEQGGYTVTTSTE